MRDLDYKEKKLKGQSFLFFPSIEEKGLFHGFSLRLKIPLEKLFEKKQYIMLDQEHEDRIHIIKNGERPKRGDGLIIFERRVIGLIKTADCLPIILFEPSIPVFGLVHAGWRGTLKGILKKAIEKMEEAGVRKRDLHVLFGPAIGPCCYEVKEDLLTLFLQKGFEEEIFQRRKNRLFLDLKKANKRQLQGVGYFYDIPLCTYCEKEILSSARRGDGTRQISFAYLNP